MQSGKHVTFQPLRCIAADGTRTSHACLRQVARARAIPSKFERESKRAMRRSVLIFEISAETRADGSCHPRRRHKIPVYCAFPKARLSIITARLRATRVTRCPPL